MSILNEDQVLKDTSGVAPGFGDTIDTAEFARNCHRVGLCVDFKNPHPTCSLRSRVALAVLL